MLKKWMQAMLKRAESEVMPKTVGKLGGDAYYVVHVTAGD